MQKVLVAVITVVFILLFFTGCDNEALTKKTVEKHFINAIVLASERAGYMTESVDSIGSKKIIVDSMYVYSKKILEEQTYRDKALENEKFFNKRFANTLRFEQELTRGLIGVAKFYFSHKELSEMFKRVVSEAEKERTSYSGYLKRKWSYRVEKRLVKIEATFHNLLNKKEM